MAESTLDNENLFEIDRDLLIEHFKLANPLITDEQLNYLLDSYINKSINMCIDNLSSLCQKNKYLTDLYIGLLIQKLNFKKDMLLKVEINKSDLQYITDKNNANLLIELLTEMVGPIKPSKDNKKKKSNLKESAPPKKKGIDLYQINKESKVTTTEPTTDIYSQIYERFKNSNLTSINEEN